MEREQWMLENMSQFKKGKGKKKSTPYQNIMMKNSLLGQLRKTKQKEEKRETGRENIQHVATPKHTISREKHLV